MIAKLLAGKFALPVIGGAIALAAAGSFYAAWSWQDARTTGKVAEAVNDANREANRAMNKEREMTAYYRNLADKKLDALGNQIAGIKVQQQSIRDAVKQAAQENPEFFNQPIPPKGYEAWQKARSLLKPASTASQPSAPSASSP